jgi:hypothetical protein
MAIVLLAAVACAGGEEGTSAPGSDPGAPAAFPSATGPLPAATASVTAGSAAATDATCVLPTYSDAYLGFRVGRPASWRLSYIDGVVHVAPDASGREEALVYPVRLALGATAETLSRSYVSALNDALATRGGTLRLSGSDLSGTIGGAPVTGEIRTRPASGVLVLYGGWSPSARWSQERATILAVGQCYSSIPAKLLQRATRTASDVNLGSTTFEYALPEGWRVDGVTPRGIDLALDRTTLVSYAYLTGSFGEQTPESFADLIFGSLGYTVRIVTSEGLGAATDPLGYRWTEKGFEFDGQGGGQALHGVLTVAVGTFTLGGYATSNAMASLRQSSPDRWESMAAITAVVQESIRIVDARPGQGVLLARNNPLDSSSILSSYEYKSAVDARLSSQRQEAIMGFENVRSPSTGTTYQAPLNAYDPTGPSGPGYYRPLPGGGRELLQPVNR